MIAYKQKQALKQCVVCLWDPAGGDFGFSKENLCDFINACAWQLERGETPRRIPFHLTNIPSDADRAVEDMRKIIQETRKEQGEPTNARKWAMFEGKRNQKQG